ncbi:MAG TPA: hypothetical protein VK590_15890 [Saprospiraceae bacterium]|nr:hypothetical protein [Saprospiraceae bacterium]
MEDEKLIKGFNAGYLSGKFKPDLTKQISQGITESEDQYAFGFMQGVKQYELDFSKEAEKNKVKEHQEKLQKLRQSFTSKNEKDKDHGIDR